MTTKKRVILIILGVITFAIAAPLLLFIAQGYRYDFSQKRVVKTGTISAKSDPRGAQIFLNGKAISSTPATKRFLIPGEYDLQISKDGYQSWATRVTVNKERVTAVPAGEREKIFLLLSQPERISLESNVADVFTSPGNNFLLKNSNNTFSVPGIQSGLIFTAPKLADARDGRIIVYDDNKFYYVSSERQLQLDNTLREAKLGQNSNIIFGINSKQELLEINIGQDQTTILDKNIAALAIQGDNVFYLKNGDERQLIKRSLLSPLQMIAANLPQFSEAKIIISPERYVFLLLDKSLYQITENLELINQEIKYALWQESAKGLIYGNDNEAWTFMPDESQPNQLLTRTTEKLLIPPAVNREIGYFFVEREGEIDAIELDPLGKPNQFAITKLAGPLKKLAIDESGENLFLLEGEKLHVLKIR